MWQCFQRCLPPSTCESLDALSFADLRQCLVKTHEYFRDHRHVAPEGSACRVERDAGPGSVQDWRDCEERRNYNGEGGGRYFAYYAPAIFERCLEEMMASRANCTERQVMAALAKTNERVHKYQRMKDRFELYAGPQCIAHVRCLREVPCGAPSAWKTAELEAPATPEVGTGRPRRRRNVTEESVCPGPWELSSLLCQRSRTVDP